MRPASIMDKIADAWLSNAVKFSDFSLAHTFRDETKNLADCSVGKNSIAVIFASSYPSIEMSFYDVYFQVFPSRESF
jgi:hypothetical protein